MCIRDSVYITAPADFSRALRNKSNKLRSLVTDVGLDSDLLQIIQSMHCVKNKLILRYYEYKIGSESHFNQNVKNTEIMKKVQESTCSLEETWNNLKEAI